MLSERILSVVATASLLIQSSLCFALASADRNSVRPDRSSRCYYQRFTNLPGIIEVTVTLSKGDGWSFTSGFLDELAKHCGGVIKRSDKIPDHRDLDSPYLMFAKMNIWFQADDRIQCLEGALRCWQSVSQGGWLKKDGCVR